MSKNWVLAYGLGLFGIGAGIVVSFPPLGTTLMVVGVILLVCAHSMDASDKADANIASWIPHVERATAVRSDPLPLAQTVGPSIQVHFDYDSANSTGKIFAITLVNVGDQAASGVQLQPMRSAGRTISFERIENIPPAPHGSASVAHMTNDDTDSTRFDYPALIMGAPHMGGGADLIPKMLTQISVTYGNSAGTDYFQSNCRLIVCASSTRYTIHSEFLSRERARREVLVPIALFNTLTERPEVYIVGWGGNPAEVPEFQFQSGFRLHNSGARTAVGISVDNFDLPFDVPDSWKGNEVSIIDRRADGFMPIYRVLGASPIARWNLDGWLEAAFPKERFPGNATVRIVLRYKDTTGKKRYTTTQDLIFAANLKRIVGFSTPQFTEEEVET